MFCSLEYCKLSASLKKEVKITIDFCGTIFRAKKQFSSTFIRMSFPRFITLLKKEASTSKVAFTSCSKPIRTKNSWGVQWGKTQLITKPEGNPEGEGGEQI